MIGVKCIFKIYFYLRITKQNKKVVHFPLLYIEIEQVIFKPEMLYCINFVLIITRYNFQTGSPFDKSCSICVKLNSWCKILYK